MPPTERYNLTNLLEIPGNCLISTKTIINRCWQVQSTASLNFSTPTVELIKNNPSLIWSIISYSTKFWTTAVICNPLSRCELWFHDIVRRPVPKVTEPVNPNDVCLPCYHPEFEYAKGWVILPSTSMNCWSQKTFEHTVQYKRRTSQAIVSQ